MIIYLGDLLPNHSCNLPANIRRTTLFAAWSCSWRGLPCRWCYHHRGGLLPHHFTLTADAAVSFLWHSL